MVGEGEEGGRDGGGKAGGEGGQISMLIAPSLFVLKLQSTTICHS